MTLSGSNLGIGTTSPQQALHVSGSICAGTSNTPFQRLFDSSNRQRETKHYFKCVKGTGHGTTTTFDIITVDINQNFHQAICKVFYGSRLQQVSDSTTNVSEIIFGINRFNGGSIGITRHVVNQQSNAFTHGNIDVIATSSTNYRVRATFSSSTNGSSFICGSAELIGVGSGDDGAFYSLAHSHGLLA